MKNYDLSIKINKLQKDIINEKNKNKDLEKKLKELQKSLDEEKKIL